ncbi:MAG: hypothetical protein LBI74_07150 [Synergistaceae bacterium]|jgi:tetratricopeptide (TPR) repeat protein|nr:hypothetical protein [Synergistaceae bacterium]
MNRRTIKRTALACCAAVFVALAAAGGNAFAAESRFERARNLYDIHEYNVALVLFEKVIESEPENGEALDFASWCNRYLGNWETAKKGFQQAEQLLPGKLSKWVKVGLGETYLGAGAYGESILAFEQAIGLDPDDEELVVRARKGIVLANASLMDSKAMNTALSDLSGDVAAEVKEDADALLERQSASNKPGEATASETVSSGNLSNADERRAAVFEAAAASSERETAETPDQQGPAEPKERETGSSPANDDRNAPGNGVELGSGSIWSVLSLGEPIEGILSGLSGLGISIQKVEEPTRSGAWIHILGFPPGMAPPAVTNGDADTTMCVIEEFQGRLRAVTITSFWENRKSCIRMKDAIFKETAAKLNERLRVIGAVTDSGLFTEAQWVLGESPIGVSLSGTAGLDGSIIVETIYIDLSLI